MFEGKEKLRINWIYYIILDEKKQIYYAAYATAKDMCIYNFRPFKEYLDAIEYITKAINFYR